MKVHKNISIGLILGVMTLLSHAAFVSGQTAAMTRTQESAVLRDGQHDFDPLIGTWKAQLKRLVHPLSGSNTWVEFEGTQITRSIWGGRATMDEFKVDNPATNSHIDGLTIRLYNPESRQWSIYWANAKQGSFSLPPTVGRWVNGRGEFYDQEMFEGRMILVRYVWSDITSTSAHFEQSFSDDGGKTWEPNWISTITREKGSD